MRRMARAATTADAFNAVAEPRRRAILDVLAGGERPVNDLVRELGVTQPQVSKHLRVLREVGAVEVREEGRRRLYSAERPRAEADPRLGQDLRAHVVGAVRAARRRARRTEGDGMTATVTLPTEEQILITREFDAPRHLVYRAWTTPELVRRWWSGRRGEMQVAEIDLRVGGIVALRDDRRGRLRGRLPRRVPRDRRERADRDHRGVRGDARRRGARTSSRSARRTAARRSSCSSSAAAARSATSILESGMEAGMQEQMDKLEELVTGPLE